MKERDNYFFYDTSTLKPTPNISQYASKEYLQKKLSECFPDHIFEISFLKLYDKGNYKKHFKHIKHLPSFYEIQISHSTGQHSETITIWSPLAWNNRFIGCPGGGTSTGGSQCIAKPDNTERGLTLPKAVLNGFTGATTDAGNTAKEWALDANGTLDWERIENWRSKSTHVMTLFGKAIAEILHNRPVQYAYLHGGSGGGRQSMVEAQEYPDDYNGIWASCPAIYWPRFLPIGFWAVAVMNSMHHTLTPNKIHYFMEEAQNSVGGKLSYYKRQEPVEFDPASLLGHKTKDGKIKEKDISVMKAVWNGPHDSSGNFLWYAHRPGVHFWNIGFPVGAFYYTLFRKKPKPFFLSVYYCRWITENSKDSFQDITMEQFEKLYHKSCSKFASCMADQTDLTAFYKHNGKLMIDHGTDDPLIPVDGTKHYYKELCQTMGSAVVDSFCRLYITPGDGHGNCRWHGPGITEQDGMKALINWVEHGETPERLRTVQVNFSGETLQESSITPVQSN